LAARPSGRKGDAENKTGKIHAVFYESKKATSTAHGSFDGTMANARLHFVPAIIRFKIDPIEIVAKATKHFKAPEKLFPASNKSSLVWEKLKPVARDNRSRLVF
jgi:hypothetical protein